MSQSFIKHTDNGPHSALSGLGVLNAERRWAVHVSGPDDVHAAPDRAQAVAAAARFNDWFDKRRDPHPLDPQMHAKVIEWPYSAESHAKDLPRWPEFATPGVAPSLKGQG